MRQGDAVKVLMVIDSLRLGGAERVLATLSTAAPTAGFRFEVHVLSLPGHPRAAMEPVLERAGASVQYLSLRRLADPRALPRLVRAIRRSRCDVVHAHLEDAATLVPAAARIAGRPSVCSFHHVSVPLRGREAVKERLAIAAANTSACVVFVSHASLESFARAYGGSQRNWCVIENGVDLEEFDSTPGLPAEVPLATIVGALRGRKGHAVALRAWRQVLERFPQARLAIVGDGPELGRLRALAAELGIAERVIFAGTRADVPELIRASWLVLLPTEHEALPTTLMEAAACGRPAVATRVDGVPEVVDDGRTGLLVPFGDERALAGATIELLADDSRRAQMGAAARQLAEERFDARRWAVRLHEVYASVAGRQAVAQP